MCGLGFGVWGLRFRNEAIPARRDVSTVILVEVGEFVVAVGCKGRSFRVWGFVGSKGQEFGVQGLEISVHVLGMKV